MKKFLRVIATLIILTITVACGKENANYDERLIRDSKKAIDEWGIIPGRTYSVTSDGNIYTVNINGNIQKVQVPLFNNELKEISDIEEVSDKEIKSICHTSKEKIKKYIDTSNIIKDKENVKHQINEIHIMIADMDDVAVYQEGKIHIGKNYTEDVCEWMILHEYVHALAEITNEGIQNEPYALTLFNEVMTDIITAYMEPDIKQDMQSWYIGYYPYIMLYIGCFNETAISSYFYGYNELYEIVGKDELDFFVYSFENMSENEIALLSVNNSINKWGASN